MKSRQPDDMPESGRDVELLLAQPSIRAEVEKLADYYAKSSEETVEPRIWGHSQQVAEAIHRLARRKAEQDFDEGAYVNAVKKNRPWRVAPRIDDWRRDYWRIFAQPEYGEEFWPRIPSRTGTSGPHPGVLGKALLFTTATTGISAHFNDNYSRLDDSIALRRLFESIELTGAIASGSERAPWSAKTYARALEQVHLISKAAFPEIGLADSLNVPDWVLATNIEISKTIHRLLGIGEFDLGLDGMLFRAQCTQVGKVDPEREAQIRRVAHRAAPRLIGGRDGKPSRFVRGYYLWTFVVLQTGEPLIWLITPADLDEPDAMKLLLKTLFRVWPDVRIGRIVADAAWDESPIIGWVLLRYGIPVVAHRHQSLLKTRYRLKKFENPGVAAFRGDGAAFCREHKCLMIRNGANTQRTRNGKPLPPGLTADENRMRVRCICPVGGDACGRRSIPMKENYAALSPYPHSLEVGQADKHAERLALLARRNSCEALHSAIQIGNKLGLSSADRTRTAKEPTVAALFSIAMITHSTRMLADIRIEAGDFPDAPPPDLEAALLAR